MNNLAYEDNYLTLKNSMKAALEEWIQETGDDFYRWKRLPLAIANN